MTRELVRVLGKRDGQEGEMKNQSSLSRRGGDCLLDQVNFLPCRGISIRLSSLITSLNKRISTTSAPGLFLSSGEWIKLKSPSTIQLISSGISMPLNQSRKAHLTSICKVHKCWWGSTVCHYARSKILQTWLIHSKKSSSLETLTLSKQQSFPQMHPQTG